MKKTVTLSLELAELCFRNLNGGDAQLSGAEFHRAFTELRQQLANAALSASAEPSAKVEAVAKEIYESWASQPGFTPWVDGGNSLKQDEARKAAQVQLSAPVERDERADCEHCSVTGIEPCTACAALDKPTEDASHE